ncbi:type I DNA topoisomerase [Candidatus Hoaglandella endobia]|uniref:DNA topoisomerase 1 n=1 Tax=Candidatus Hoaglandella endobia TaxID=1778263 RepID=A0A143WTE4_9ENTR|nr:type I DNA topoisomerase [Candidatus Hoaglandella endobia]CUX96988.1 DNA topoisomerase 1 [Candidatus Hoaglandella endobia]
MGKVLVIVESPAKAKTINKYLGNDYVVKSSIGHIRDLPTSGSASQKNIEANKKKKNKADPQSALVNSMGIDPYHGWKAQYQILPGKEKVVTELKALAEKASHIYLATDFDREGEAIAWHLREVIGGNNKRFSRVVFNEITRNAIIQAFDKPGELNINRVHAQQTRRFMDRLVGYMVSPLLWEKIARGLSAGRVQSVAVRLVVEREREIKAFIPKEYWKLHANLITSHASTLAMQVTHQKGKLFQPVHQQQIQAAISLLEKANFVVSNNEKKPISSKPSAPFTTATLQQAASNYLGYDIKKTMILAQSLYEMGHITYMRTNSTNLSQDALNMVRCYIIDTFGNKYLPKQANKYVSKDNTQEAHEAIRPSDVHVLAEQLNDTRPEAQKIYHLIWRQFIACQMTPARYDDTTLSVTAGEFQLRTRCRALRFDGWTIIMPALHKVEDRILPAIKIGQTLILEKLLPSQHFTKPLARYSESSLVKELEKRKIGRPSTYVSIISNIQDRGYVHVENCRFYADKMGEIVTDCLEENFHELMNYDFTAKMEDKLDQVAASEQEWKSVLDTFFEKFSQQLEKAKKDPQDGGMGNNKMVMIRIDCPVCSRKMGIRTASTGVFLGCSGYILPPKERCKNSINLIPEVETINLLDGDDAETNALRARRRCAKCHTAMDSYLIVDSQSKLYVCGNNPLCEGYEIEQGQFCIKGYDGTIVECEKCGSDMHLKLGRFGKYMACTNEVCNNTRKILRHGDVAPPKEDPVPLPELHCERSDAYFVLRNGASGVFLAANTFPKSRETRAPLVAELARFRERLPEKLHYLADAPAQDEAGNSTLVRFSRKTKQQYIASEKNGKATGWTLFYLDGQWQLSKK